MSLQSRYILRTRVDATSYDDAAERVLAWAARRESRYVCVATVNQVMVGLDSADFLPVINSADLVTPDGMPLVWGLRWQGVREATRVYGPDLMQLVLQAAEQENIEIGLYGASPAVLAQLLGVIGRRYPRLRVAYAWSPPYRPLTPEEDERVTEEINRSGARILFVGISSPKQDCWMGEHRGRIQSVMLGVGAAFDFMAGNKPQAPRWMQKAGLEWSFRLATEPRRLWKRYLRQNPRFLAHFAWQLLRSRDHHQTS